MDLQFGRQSNQMSFSYPTMNTLRKKVLLMGKSGSGKTSMRSIIFAHFIARDTCRLGPTMDVEHTHLRLLGGLILNLWDCGGQDGYMESYFFNQREAIFRNVEVLIYVFDIESRDLNKDVGNYRNCLEAILQQSPNAKIFCLINKMDLVGGELRDRVYNQRKRAIEEATKFTRGTFFATSIWDESLFRAWSKIVYDMIPNVRALEQNLEYLCDVLEADEIILFERSTFLLITMYESQPHSDKYRFEKISNIIRQFKLSCSHIGANFTRIIMRNQFFAAVIDTFTSNTFIMVVFSDPSIATQTILLNLRNSRKHFEHIERLEQRQSAIAPRRQVNDRFL